MARALVLIGGLLAGVTVALSGVLYFALSVGVPSQDAPPQLRATEDFHTDVAGALWLAGLGILLVTVLLGCALLILSAITRRSARRRAGVR